jgi:hypothetical protein
MEIEMAPVGTTLSRGVFVGGDVHDPRINPSRLMGLRSC